MQEDKKLRLQELLEQQKEDKATVEKKTKNVEKQIAELEAATKELNEALVSRFLVIDMPAQTEETLGFIFHQMFPNARESAVEQFVGLFLDLQLKALNSEISTKALDLRGLLAAMKIVDVGLSPAKAVRMGVVNKTFDVFEREIVEDVVSTRIPSEWTREDVYE